VELVINIFLQIIFNGTYCLCTFPTKMVSGLALHIWNI